MLNQANYNSFFDLLSFFSLLSNLILMLKIFTYLARGYKTFFMLNSAEHEITTNKTR